MIYTKRQFQEGVTFYTDSFTGNVYDIDIDQDVTELYLSGDKAQHYVIKEVRMYENKKRFPQIERIYIADSVMSIRIPNKMFPNVKEIISDSKSFQSGNLLIRKALGVCLFNTFCKKADELIDLNGVKQLPITHLTAANLRISLMRAVLKRFIRMLFMDMKKSRNFQSWMGYVCLVTSSWIARPRPTFRLRRLSALTGLIHASVARCIMALLFQNMPGSSIMILISQASQSQSKTYLS